MSALRRLACFIFGHAPERGLNRRLCIFFICTRCGAAAPGDFATTRNKRK